MSACRKTKIPPLGGHTSFSWSSLDGCCISHDPRSAGGLVFKIRGTTISSLCLAARSRSVASLVLAVLFLVAWPSDMSNSAFVGGQLPSVWIYRQSRSPCPASGATQDEKADSYVGALEILVAAQDEGPVKLRNTFRRLARVMHPDVAGDSVEAADTFRALLEAYNVVEKGGGGRALAAARLGEVPSRAKDVTGLDALRTTDKFHGRRRDKCFPGDVVLFRFRSQDVDKFELKGRCDWGLAVVTCDDGGFVHGQRLVFEDSGDGKDRYQSGWLTTDDYEEEVLIDPMAPLEVVASYTSQDGSRYQVTRPVDTMYVYAQWFGWE